MGFGLDQCLKSGQTWQHPTAHLNILILHFYFYYQKNLNFLRLNIIFWWFFFSILIFRGWIGEFISVESPRGESRRWLVDGGRIRERPISVESTAQSTNERPRSHIRYEGVTTRDPTQQPHSFETWDFFLNTLKTLLFSTIISTFSETIFWEKISHFPLEKEPNLLVVRAAF